MNKKEKDKMYDILLEGWESNYKNKPLYKEIQKILHPENINYYTTGGKLFRNSYLDEYYRSHPEKVAKLLKEGRITNLNREMKFEKLPKDFYNSEEWAKKRIEILTRDNFKCIHCGNPANHVDHINSAYYFPQLALDNDNLISSCEECHKKRQPRGKWK